MISPGAASKVAAKRGDTARVMGAITASCSGVGGATTIAATHGSSSVALAVFFTMQAWGACELLFRWRLKWRHARLQEAIVIKAMEKPDDEGLRTLLADVASTHLSDLGERLPIRRHLTD